RAPTPPPTPVRSPPLKARIVACVLVLVNVQVPTALAADRRMMRPLAPVLLFTTPPEQSRPHRVQFTGTVSVSRELRPLRSPVNEPVSQTVSCCGLGWPRTGPVQFVPDVSLQSSSWNGNCCCDPSGFVCFVTLIEFDCALFHVQPKKRWLLASAKRKLAPAGFGVVGVVKFGIPVVHEVRLTKFQPPGTVSTTLYRATSPN